MSPPPTLRAALALAATLFLGTACSSEYVDVVARFLAEPSALAPGDSFALRNEVCNEGTLPSDPTFIEFMLRIESAHSTANPIGTRPVPALDPGACDSEETSLWIPSAVASGAYEIVGLVDPAMELGEPWRRNNIALTGVFGVGWEPDLVIEALAHDPTVEKNQPFGVQMQVCNRGRSWADESQVMVLLSVDSEISLDGLPGPDWVVGTLDAPDLDPEQCAPVSGIVNASSDEGTLQVGAVADYSDVVFETVESNNTAVAGPIGVGLGPDLVIERIVGPPSAKPGSNPTEFEVRVCNQGTDAASDVWTSFYLSEDPIIEPGFPDPASGDPHLDGFYTSHLDPGACQDALLSVYIPSELEGPFFPGAYADDSEFVPELIETNNALAGPVMGVGFDPDLIVTSIEAPPSVDGSFDVEVRVCNVGTDDAVPVMASLFLSADETLSPMPEGDDPEVGALFLPGVAAGECITAPAPAWASVPSEVPENGPYRLMALVDPMGDTDELIETNNAYVGPTLGVGMGPDLVVTAVSGPPSSEGSFEASATVCNQGTDMAGDSWLQFYHSLDPVIQGGPPWSWGPGPPDFMAGGMPVPSLEPGVCVDLLAEWLTDSVPMPGAYFLGAYIDDGDAVAELIETNNALAGPLMGVGPGPDLVVTRVMSAPSTTPGSSVDLDVEVCNLGTRPAGGTDARLYASDDGVIQGSSAGPLATDFPIAYVAVPGLDPGECFETLEWAQLPLELEGVVTLGGIVDEYDDVPGELIETNNVHAGAEVMVGYGPNLVVMSLTSDPSVAPFDWFDVQATICNTGTMDSNWVDVSLYLSEDTDLEGSYFVPGGEDPFLGFHPVAPILAGACEVVDVQVQPWVPDGAWYLGAIVNEGEHLDELRLDDNDLLGPIVGVGDGPDLVVTSLVVPAVVDTGVDFTVDATVCNQGTNDSWASDLALYHSTDATLTTWAQSPVTPDLLLGWIPVPPLPPGACAPVSGDVRADSGLPGWWHLGAYVDEGDGIPELVESNNDRVAPAHLVQ